MSEGAWVAVLGVLGTLVTTLGGVAVTVINKKLRTVTDHVQNSHKDPVTGEAYNLRDNIDDNQREVLAELRGMRKDIGRLGDRDVQLGDDLRDLRRDLARHLDWSDGFVKDIESTLNPNRGKG